MAADHHDDPSPRHSHKPPDQRQQQDRSRRSWRWYVDDEIETDPVELVQALGLLTVSRQSRHYEQSLYEQIHRTLLLDELTALAEQLDDPPSPIDMRRFGAYAPYEYLDVFGTWTETLQAADLPTPSPKADQRGPVDGKCLQFECLPELFENEVDDAELIRDLRNFASVIGAPPQPVDMQKFGPRTSQAYIDRFGSWQQALTAARIRSAPSQSKSDRVYSQEYEAIPAEVEQTVTSEDLCQELRRLAVTLETIPTQGDVTKFSAYTPQMYLDQFGSWTEVLQAAEITREHRDSNGLRRWWSPIRWLCSIYRLICR